MGEKEDTAVSGGEKREEEVRSQVLRVQGVGDENRVVIIESIHVDEVQDENNNLEDYQPRDDGMERKRLREEPKCDSIDDKEEENVVAHTCRSFSRGRTYAFLHERQLSSLHLPSRLRWYNRMT